MTQAQLRAARPALVLAAAMALLVPGGGARPARAGEAVGKIVRCTGPILLRRGARPAHAVAARDQCESGDVLRLGASAAATLVFYNSGLRFQLLPRSACRVGGTGLARMAGPTPRRLPPVPPALAQWTRAAGSAFAASVSRGGGGPGDAHHLSPVGAVTPGPLILRWEGPDPPPGAAPGDVTLRLRLRDPQTGSAPLDATLPSTARFYDVPPNVVAGLQPGRWYEWSVTTLGPSDHVGAAAAPLRPLRPGDEAALSALEAAADRAGAREPDARLLLAEAAEILGFFTVALAENRQVLKAWPTEAEAQAAAVRLEALLGGS